MNFYNFKGYWRIKHLKNILFKKTLPFPKLVQCNICKWSGRKFLDDYWHKKVVCPACQSDVRHRLLHLSLRKIDIEGKKILHFAPESCLEQTFEKSKHYKTADLVNFENLDFKIDISDMSIINDNTFDIVIASDVLEHVYNDQKAIKEINRILKIQGIAVLTVPQGDNLKYTIEDLNYISKEERELKFGNYDHYRLYGSDFKKKLEDEKFIVKVFEAQTFGYKVSKYHVLRPPVVSANPLATNIRKIYHATKF